MSREEIVRLLIVCLLTLYLVPRGFSFHGCYLLNSFIRFFSMLCLPNPRLELLNFLLLDVLIR